MAARAPAMTCDANNLMLFHRNLTPREGQIDRTEVMPGPAPPALPCTLILDIHPALIKLFGLQPCTT